MRTNKIYEVIVARYVTMFVEADSVNDAVDFAKAHCDEIDEYDYLECESEVASCDTVPAEAERYMSEIWTKDGKLTYYEYKEEINND